jgi:hypothetical protein
LTKVVHHLGMIGFVETVRGRHGGLSLGMEPDRINIGEVVRSMQSDSYIAGASWMEITIASIWRPTPSKAYWGMQAAHPSAFWTVSHWMA